jgi:hypothetical protein
MFKNTKAKVICSDFFTSTKINKRNRCNTKCVLKTTFITSLGHNRMILGTHHWYKIREDFTLPAKNQWIMMIYVENGAPIELEAETKENRNKSKYFH